MVDIIYNFVFGSGFIDVLASAGFSDDMSYSLMIIARLECVFIAFYFLALTVYFFMCLIRRKRGRSII